MCQGTCPDATVPWDLPSHGNSGAQRPVRRRGVIRVKPPGSDPDGRHAAPRPGRGASSAGSSRSFDPRPISSSHRATMPRCWPPRTEPSPRPTPCVGRDWLDAWSSGADVGHKVVAQNLADVAAMGGRPTGVLVTLVTDPMVSWNGSSTSGVASRRPAMEPASSCWAGTCPQPLPEWSWCPSRRSANWWERPCCAPVPATGTAWPCAGRSASPQRDCSSCSRTKPSGIRPPLPPAAAHAAT